MTERQIKALNNLYMATIEVMEAFAPEMVDANMRRETVARMLENFLMGAANVSGGVNVPVHNKVGHTTSIADSCTDSEKPDSPDEKKEENKTEDLNVAQKDLDVADADIRFAESPVEGAFRRPKTEEDKEAAIGRAISEGLPAPRYNYRLYVVDGVKGSFELIKADKEAIKAMNSDNDILAGATELVPDSVAVSEASSVVTVERGEIVKDGKRWRIVRPAKIRYQK